MAVHIVFGTHSTTFDNEAGRASGWNDAELSPKGTEQSKQLGERHKSSGFAAIFCSDLRRAHGTAEIAFADRDIPIIKDARLRECDYGDMTSAASSEVEAQKPLRINEPFPSGESYEQTTARMKSFLDDLACDYDGKKVLVIGHRATQYALDNLILGRPLKDIVGASFAWQPGWNYRLG